MGHKFAMMLKNHVMKLMQQVKKEAPKHGKAKRGAEEGGQATAADEEDDGADAGKAPATKKRKLGRGERDGDEKEDAVAAEEAAADKAGNEDDDDDDDGSGMYNSSDSEK